LSAGTVSQAFCASSNSSWPGGPAGVAERDQRARGTFAARHLLQDVARGADRHAVAEAQRRAEVARVVVQHEAAVGLHRPADQHGLAAERGRVGGDLHLPQHFVEVVFGAMVDHQAHGAEFVVLADQGDAAHEMRIGSEGIAIRK
jgi:hypothetical protein